MASKNILSHSIAGNVGTSLSSRGVRWFRWGDAIAYTYKSYGTYATADLFSLWKGSSSHWDLLMSPRFNYIGIGMTYRSSNHKTFGDVVLIDGPDRSAPGAAMVSVSRDGDDVTWTWRGWDVILQTQDVRGRQLRRPGPDGLRLVVDHRIRHDLDPAIRHESSARSLPRGPRRGARWRR